MLGREDALIIGTILLFLLEMIMLIKHTPFKKNFSILTFAAYIICLISITFFPIIYQTKGYDCAYNFIPLHTIKDYLCDLNYYSILSLFGNLFLLVPWGFLFKPIFKGDFKKFFIITILLILGIESLQHILNLIIGYRYRCVDIDDILLNLSGSFIGYAVYKKLPKKIRDIIKY